MRYLRAFAILIALIWSAPLWAVQPDEMLSNPALEARARCLRASCPLSASPSWSTVYTSR